MKICYPKRRFNVLVNEASLADSGMTIQMTGDEWEKALL